MKTYRKKLRTYEEVNEYVRNNLQILKHYYLTEGLTGRKVAEKCNVEYSQLFQKALFKHCGAKGLGHGGARPGAGNKPGIEWCGTCGKAKKNCTC